MDNLNNVLFFGTIIAPVILVLVELLKRSAPIPRNSIPLLALVLGTLVGLLAAPFTDLDWTLRL